MLKNKISLWLLPACFLPPLRERRDHRLLRQDEVAQTRLGEMVLQRGAIHAGLSGIHPLSDARDAFAARVLLARLAEKTLDVQYYIWRKDITGILLLHELQQAAERGVRVRLLLDDNGISGMDDCLAELNAHPNMEVRLFNPFTFRRAKFLGFVTDFARANRRMHNKSFTVDQQVTIAGGRNIGDEYFAATDGVLFADLDVIAAGPAGREAGEDFDRYWASDSAYPVELLFSRHGAGNCLAAEVERISALPEAAEYASALRDSDFTQNLFSGDLRMEWARTQLVSDDPAKGLGKVDDSNLMIHNLTQLLGMPTKSLDLVSSYFVPTRAGVEVFSNLAQQGIQVRVLTNALEATDVSAVHSGYARHRKALLEAGVQLYEMRRNPVSHRRRKGRRFGSSGSSLHAKTFAVDGQRLFIGSFNFDPRSANLNTELGFVIDSSEMAETMNGIFAEQALLESYEVRLDGKGRLYWLEQLQEGRKVEHYREPNVSLLKRAAVKCMSWLPIEWLL